MAFLDAGKQQKWHKIHKKSSKSLSTESKILILQ